MKNKSNNKFIGCFRAKDISPLYACVWLLLLLLASCGETVEVSQPELPVGTPVRVTAELQVSVCPIAAVQPPATRGEEAADSTALGVSYLPTSATRADVAMSAAEKEIKSAYVVQFDGTAPTSTAVWVSTDVAAHLKSGSPVNVSFTLTAGVKSRVYVIANPTKVPTVNMTLQAFETVSYTVSTLPATGLPMVAYQDVEADEIFGLFLLKSPLARLTFTTTTGTLTLKGIPSAYSLVPATPGASAVRPSGVTYTNTLSLTSGTTYYVPANLSGREALSSPMIRCSNFAPVSSMQVVISANSTTYSIYLGDGSAQDFNVLSNYAYTINAIVNGTDNDFDWRVGTPPNVTILDSKGTANCYIAYDYYMWYSFDATVMGNGATTPAHTAGVISGDINSPAIIPKVLNPVSADVLWETSNTTAPPARGSIVKPTIYIANGRIYFRSSNERFPEGNAVIAARDATGTIIWSWHIWRKQYYDPEANAVTLAPITATEGTFGATGTNTISGLKIMDRNLGALSATPYSTNNAEGNLSTGLHYQWGRKDPFPGGADLASGSAMATNPAGIPVIPSSEKQYTVAESIQQPTTFLMYSGDWCSVRTDNLWGTPLINMVKKGYNAFNSNSGNKSIYDPCPVGWRVASCYAFANAIKPSGADFDTDKGYSFGFLTSGSSWFPASGYRHNIYGTLEFVGSYGTYWTSSALANYVSNGSILEINSSYVSPAYYLGRANGAPVRCMKE